MWETFKKSEQLLHIIITEIHRDHDLCHQLNRMMKERLLKSIVYLPTTEQYDIAKFTNPCNATYIWTQFWQFLFLYFGGSSSHKNYRMWEKNCVINVIRDKEQLTFHVVKTCLFISTFHQKKNISREAQYSIFIFFINFLHHLGPK